MIIAKEYKEYINDNYLFIQTLKEHNSITYDRLSDLIKVLNIIVNDYGDKEKVEEEIEVIFESGFSFFHEQFEQIKLYYEKYFKSDYLSFRRFEFFINYSLSLEDLQQSLEEKEILDQHSKEKLNQILKEVDDIITNQKETPIEILDAYNEELDQLLMDQPEVLTTLDIFTKIYEELE